VSDLRHPQAMQPAGDDQPVDPVQESEPVVEAILREPPIDSVLLDRPPDADVPSLTLALSGTFVLRCASQAAGFLVAVSLGIKSRDELNLTAGVASLVFVCFYAAELIGAPLFGAWSDRIGRKPVMLLGPVFGAIAAQLLGLTMLIPVLVVVRILQGLSTASSAPATLGFLSAQTARSEKLRGRVMGFYEAATVVGLAVGAAVGGKLHDQFGQFAFTIVAVLYVAAVPPCARPRLGAARGECAWQSAQPDVEPTHHAFRASLARGQRRTRRLVQRWHVPGGWRAEPSPVPDAGIQRWRNQHRVSRIWHSVHGWRDRLGLRHARDRSADDVTDRGGWAGPHQCCAMGSQPRAV
jgi:hypothetical protein